LSEHAAEEYSDGNEDDDVNGDGDDFEDDDVVTG